MKKIPTLFVRTFENHSITGICPVLTDPSLSWVLEGKGIATEKIDGACCAFINGIFYKRYDAKKGKQPPNGSIACDDPDPVTGHWPHWAPILDSDPGTKWYRAARDNTGAKLPDGTYEAIGPHFQGNPYHLEKDILVRHGEKVIDLLHRSFEGISDYLYIHNIEGIVFWKDGKPQCKIKRSDFGFKWPN